MSQRSLRLAFAVAASLGAGAPAHSQTAEQPPEQSAPAAKPAPAPEVKPAPEQKLPDVEVIQETPKPEPAKEAAPKPQPKPVAEEAAAQPTPAAKPKKKKIATKPKPANPEAKVAQAKPAPAPAEEFPKPQPPSAAETSPSSEAAALAELPGTLLVSVDAFAPITTAMPREIEAKQGQTLTDTLATKPGINASSFAPGASRPIVRGLDNNRVRVQENGIGSHDASTVSEDHAVPIDPYAAERVEVIRGPATLRYGSQAVGGVVSVENDRIPSVIPPDGFSGAIRGGWSSVDDGGDGSFKATAGANGIAVHADGFKRDAGNYDTPLGIQDNSFVESEGGAVGASFIGSDGLIGVAFVRVESQYGIPAEVASIDLEQDKILSRGEWRVQSGGIDVARFWFGASDYAHDEVAGGEVGSRFTNREQEARAEIEQQAIATSLGDLNGALGVQWGHRRIQGQSFEGDSLLEPATTDRIAGFVFQELSLSRALKFQAAGRFEHVAVNGTGLLDFSNPLDLVRFTGEKSYTPLGASTGLAYELPLGVVARLTGQYTERAPEAEELFSQGLHEATGTFEIGNPNLEKEKAKTIEFGVKKAAGSFRFDGSIYATRFDGFISKGLTGIGCGGTIDTCGLRDELDQLVFEQRDARFYGAEFIAQYDIAPIWNGIWGVEGQYDFVNAKFDNGENVPRIPPHRLGGALYYRDGAWFARAAVLHAFEQDRIALNETPTDGYTLISAELSYTAKLQSNGITSAAPEFTIGIKGENLGDEEVRIHSSFKKNEVLQPGASVRVFGSVKLN